MTAFEAGHAEGLAEWNMARQGITRVSSGGERIEDWPRRTGSRS